MISRTDPVITAVFLTIQTVVPTRSTPKGSRNRRLFVSLPAECKDIIYGRIYITTCKGQGTTTDGAGRGGADDEGRCLAGGVSAARGDGKRSQWRRDAEAYPMVDGTWGVYNKQ